MTIYKSINEKSVLRLADGANIPFDAANRDYQEYLAWVEAGNEPLPPDPIPVVVPQTVSMAQARLALIGAGLFSAIDAGLKALPEPQRTTALTAWEYAPTVSRNGALVTTLAGQFGLTEAQLDALFTAAAAIEL
jgi:hypothetical protein